jgi:hypothetical protein
MITAASLTAALAAANVNDGDVIQYISVVSPDAPLRVTRFAQSDGTFTVYIEQ